MAPPPPPPRFKELADKKKEISNADLESIVNDEIKMVAEDRFEMVRIQVRARTPPRTPRRFGVFCIHTYIHNVLYICSRFLVLAL